MKIKTTIAAVIAIAVIAPVQAAEYVPYIARNAIPNPTSPTVEAGDIGGTEYQIKKTSAGTYAGFKSTVIDGKQTYWVVTCLADEMTDEKGCFLINQGFAIEISSDWKATNAGYDDRDVKAGLSGRIGQETQFFAPSQSEFSAVQAQRIVDSLAAGSTFKTRYRDYSDEYPVRHFDPKGFNVAMTYLKLQLKDL